MAFSKAFLLQLYGLLPVFLSLFDLIRWLVLLLEFLGRSEIFSIFGSAKDFRDLSGDIIVD